MAATADKPDLDMLTPRQREIYEFIRSKVDGRGYGPTVREIGNEFGIKSPGGVMCHLKALQKKGFIHRVQEATQDLSRLPDDKLYVSLPPQAVDLIEELAAETHQDSGKVAHLSVELYRLALDAMKRGERLAFLDSEGQIVQEVTGLLPEDDEDAEVARAVSGTNEAGESCKPEGDE